MIVKVFHTLPQEAIEIRTDVFVTEQGFTEEFDSIDKDATHILIYEGDKAIATCRIFSGKEENTYLIGRVATRKEYRGQKLGAKVLSAAEAEVARIGGKRIKLHAQLSVKGFYEKCGYTTFGEIDYEEGCPHIWMEKNIAPM